MTDHIHHFEPFHDAPDTEACTVCGDERPAFGGGASGAAQSDEKVRVLTDAERLDVVRDVMISDDLAERVVLAVMAAMPQHRTAAVKNALVPTINDALRAEAEKRRTPPACGIEHFGGRATSPGCCDLCDGLGGNCWQCRGTGHPHAPDPRCSPASTRPEADR